MTNKLTLDQAYAILNLLASSKTLEKDMELYREIIAQKMALADTSIINMNAISCKLQPRHYRTGVYPAVATPSVSLAYDVLDHLACHTNLFSDLPRYLREYISLANCDIPFKEIYTVLKPDPNFFLYDGKPIFTPETKSVAPAQPEPEKEPARPKTEVKSVIPEAKLFEMLQAIDDEDKSIQTIGRIYQELILECPNPNPHDVQVLMDLAKRRFAPS